MTRSCLATSASRAASSPASSAMGVAPLMPSASDLAVSSVRQAAGVSAGLVRGVFAFGGYGGVPMVTGMPDAERSSRAGFATMPAPSSRTLGGRHCEHESSRCGASGPVTFGEPL